MEVIKPPTQHNPFDIQQPIIFLAGSIEQGQAEQWQDKVIARLKDERYQVVILSPRRDDWDAGWEQSIKNEQFVEQVQWELSGLASASMVWMYFDPNTKSPVSLLELGYLAHSNRLVVCCPDGYWRKGNVDIFCRALKIPQVDTIDGFFDYISHETVLKRCRL